MRRSRSKFVVTETNCPACEGTGFPLVPQPEQAGRKIYPAPCTQCFGKGRISSHGASEMTDCAIVERSGPLNDNAESAAVAVHEHDAAPMFTSNNTSN
jgi:hypothetical protein